ncbi:sulfite exporter TauE/SafE family protein, partial [Flavobacterium sp.]|uniref:sulfite exporter TauE/SafE family protein n=1 Tax=Flavobacterium sp. TaxID=239 RepID=UPI0037BF6F69
PLLTVIAGVTLGVCVALTSVGAGALGSVMLLYLYPLRMTPHRLVATDLVHAIPLAVVAGLGYLLAGLVDWQMLISLLAGSVPAIILGSLLARKVSGRWIQWLLAVVLLVAGFKTLVI